MNEETALYVLRRKDTGEYFKNVKSSWLKDWAVDDPRRRNWTKDLDKATMYCRRGIVTMLGQYRGHPDKVPPCVTPKVVEYEAVRIRIILDEVMKI